LPLTKNLALPATLDVIEIVTEAPLIVDPEKEGAPTVDDSLALVIVTVRVWRSVKDPSETVMATTYVLLVSLSSGASKSGVTAKARTPVTESIEKSAASVPEIVKRRTAPASGSVAA
jgi:hypothetical protein